MWLRHVLTFFLLVALSATVRAQTPPPSSEKIQTGVVLPRVVCEKNRDQSYALYLPSNYSRERRWPVIYAFDPGARGKIPVELFKDAAERQGFIVVGSNNSRNGPWKLEFDAAEAVVQDTQERFSIDAKRIYFAGFSGGARVASQLAQLCKCAAGVLLSGAGFSQSSTLAHESSFPVFAAVGTLDFNFGEIIRLQDQLEQAGYPHCLRTFEGPHQWAPAEAMDEALRWFRVLAMRSGREPRDANYLAAEFQAAEERAKKEESNGDLLAAWRDDRQIAATFDGLADVSQVRARAETLSQAKPLREAVKRERSDFENQEQLTSDVFRALQAKGSAEASRSDIEADVVRQVRELRLRADGEKHPDRARVLKRALAGVFVGAFESGSLALEKKDYAAAALNFSAAAEAKPDAEWPLRELAVARALEKDKKAALEALRSAQKKAQDSAEFLAWLKEEPAFESLRKSNEGREFLDPAPGPPKP